MQSTNSPKPADFWWISLEAFDDITVEDTEEGFTLSAPDESEAGKWIAHYNSTEELHAQFTQVLTKALMDRVKHYDTQEEINGQTQQNFVGSNNDPVKT